MSIRVINADVLEGLAHLADESVHCCVTSPPYWGLRQYLFDKAVVVRDDLSDVEQAFIIEELRRRGIKPRVPPS